MTIHEFGTKLDRIDYVDRRGVYAVIENNDKQIAVIETSNGYFLPGGGIDSGETEVDTLKREILEEVGHQVSVLAEIGEAVEYIKASGDEKHYQIRSKFYQVQLESKIGEGIEKDHRLGWLSPKNAFRRLTRQSQVWAVQKRKIQENRYKMSSIKIEKAIFEDLPEIVALQKLAFYQVGVYYRNFRLRQLVATLAEFEQTYTEYLYLKATEGDRIVGSARAKAIDGVCKIENVIVHPEHQRKGIGKRLLIEILEQNPEAETYELYTGKYTPGNVQFYEGLGFMVVKEIAAIRDTPLLVCMEKRRKEKSEGEKGERS